MQLVKRQRDEDRASLQRRVREQTARMERSRRTCDHAPPLHPHPPRYTQSSLPPGRRTARGICAIYGAGLGLPVARDDDRGWRPGCVRRCVRREQALKAAHRSVEALKTALAHHAAAHGNFFLDDTTWQGFDAQRLHKATESAFVARAGAGANTKVPLERRSLFGGAWRGAEGGGEKAQGSRGDPALGPRGSLGHSGAGGGRYAKGAGWVTALPSVPLRAVWSKVVWWAAGGRVLGLGASSLGLM